MARMIPSIISPNCASPGEHELFRKLRDDPSTHDWIVLHSLDIAKHVTQVAGEVDFVVIVPELGVLCVEVKAHQHVSRDAQTGLWQLGKKSEVRGPFKQAADAMHSLRKLVITGRPELAKVLFWTAVCFPYSDFDIESPEWHSWQVIDRRRYRQTNVGVLFSNVLKKARAFLSDHREAAPWFDASKSLPSLDQCELISKVLRPTFECISGFKSQRETLQDELQYYTEEQFEALDAMDAEPRVSFEGAAGTGKTLIALEAARRAKARGNRALLLCFNRLLSKWLADKAESLLPEVETRTLHKHLLLVSGLGSDIVSEQDDTFWQETLPLAASDALLSAEDDRFFFDQIIVDEAQDIICNDNYLDFLDLSVRGGWTEGSWILFGDYEKQAIYSDQFLKPKDMLKSRGFPPSHFFTYILTKNCRNPPRIAEAVRILGSMDPGYKKILRPDNGIEPKYVFYKSDQDQLVWLASVLEELASDDGYRWDDIVVVSSKNDANCAAAKLNSAPWSGRLRPFGLAREGQIRYGSIYSFKGLEAPVIVITDIESISSLEDQNLFYVGLTRAVNKLVLIAHTRVRDQIAQLLQNHPGN